MKDNTPLSLVAGKARFESQRGECDGTLLSVEVGHGGLVRGVQAGNAVLLRTKDPTVAETTAK